MERRREIVDVALRISQDRAGEQREQRGLQDRRQEVRGISQLADKCPLEQDDELVPLLPGADRLAAPRGCLRGRGSLAERGRLLHVLHQPVGLVFVAPVVRREPPCGNELPAVVFLENDVAAEIAQRGFEHVENKLRARRAAGLAASERGPEMLLVLGFGKILQHLLRRPEKHQLPAAVEQERLVEHLEDL